VFHALADLVVAERVAVDHVFPYRAIGQTVAALVEQLEDGTSADPSR